MTSFLSAFANFSAVGYFSNNFSAMTSVISSFARALIMVEIRTLNGSYFLLILPSIVLVPCSFTSIFSILSISACVGIEMSDWRIFIYLAQDNRVMKKLVFLLLLVACMPVKESVQQPSIQVESPVFEQPVPVEQIPSPAEVVKCVDSDGFDVFVKGSVMSDKLLSDSCLSVRKDGLQPISKVLEYVCDNDEVVAQIIDCEFGCENGACLKVSKPVYKLVDDGRCAEGTFGDALRVTKCYDNCLPQTMCEQTPLKTKSVSLPWQLSCLARTDERVVETWFEFEVLREVNAEFLTEVLGSEIVSVEVLRDGSLVTSPMNKKLIGNNRCFGFGSSVSRASLVPGKYVVKISARAIGADLLRSFRGKNFFVKI